MKIRNKLILFLLGLMIFFSISLLAVWFFLLVQVQKEYQKDFKAEILELGVELSDSFADNFFYKYDLLHSNKPLTPLRKIITQLNPQTGFHFLIHFSGEIYNPGKAPDPMLYLLTEEKRKELIDHAKLNSSFITVQDNYQSILTNPEKNILPIRVYYRVLPDEEQIIAYGQALYTVLARVSNQKIRTDKIRLYYLSAGFAISFISLLVLVLSLYFFTKKIITLPIEKLITRIYQYQAIDVEILDKDELKILDASFSAMIKKIAEDRESLKKINFNLESLVNERTLELKKAKNEAEIANCAKSEFIANMSHELRTPLNAVTGFSELLTSIVTDKKQMSYLNSIKTAGRSLLTLINDILDLSKIEAGKIELEKSSVSLKSLFEEIEQIFTMAMTEKNLGIFVDLDKNMPATLFLDETRVRQILLNLVGNAIKFTEKGHIKLSATISSRQETQVDLVISVEDTGIGIAKENQTRIFEVFTQQTGQQLKKYGGTGLGLTITKRLSELMNGQIEVESTIGVGSAFKVTLKSVGISSKAVPIIDDEKFSIDSILFDKARVLVVDDIKSNRELLYELLKKLNLECITAGDGQEAVMLAKEIKPDLVIMDIRMPIMDGYHANKELKENLKTAGIPVIALTASVMNIEKIQASESGFESFLTKPIKIEKLLETLSKFLPYTTKEKEIKNDIELIEERIEGVVVQPAELILKLKNEILPSFQTQKRAMVMEDISELANKIKGAGKTHNLQAFTDYAAELHNNIKLFDVLAIQKKFHNFQNKIEVLISKLEKIK